jgi:hypothetical protein
MLESIGPARSHAQPIFERRGASDWSNRLLHMKDADTLQKCDVMVAGAAPACGDS